MASDPVVSQTIALEERQLEQLVAASRQAAAEARQLRAAIARIAGFLVPGLGHVALNRPGAGIGFLLFFGVAVAYGQAAADPGPPLVVALVVWGLNLNSLFRLLKQEQ